jgi:hypothetical protein
VHVGLRNQKNSARYFPIADAEAFVSPSSSVLVIENKGVARAHPDAQIMRPHLAGNAEGLAGKNVVMTYCAMANLGVGYTPEIEGRSLDLEVLAQHGNNLILRDNKTGAPIQQILGIPENDIDRNAEGAVCAVRPSAAMRPWPTFRMSFRGFKKAYPNGTVFINKPSSNPLLALFDRAIETVFSSEISRQHRVAAPIIANMSREPDRRLHNKAYVWGVTHGRDATCWTDDFVVEQGGIVNASVGGRPVVVAWDPIFECLGVWWNDTGGPVQRIDFFGESDRGRLSRVETLRPGLFWHVWAEFFPSTDVNRADEARAAEVA